MDTETTYHMENYEGGPIGVPNRVTKKEAVKLRDMAIKRLSKLLALIIKNGTAVESVYSETSSALLMAKSKGIEKTLEEIKQNI